MRETEADQVIAVWQPFFLGLSRSSRFLKARHSARYRLRYARALEARRPGESTADELTAEARILDVLGRDREARRAFGAALRLDPECAAAWAWRWNADVAAAPLERVDEGLDRAVALEPRRALWVAMRGLVRTADFFKNGARGIARPLADLERALDLDEDCLPALISSGMVLATAGLHRQALEFYGRALKRDPGPSFLYAFRGRSRMSLGDRDGCVADCEAAVYASEGLGYFTKVLDAAGSNRTAAQLIEAATRHLRRHRRDYWMYAYRGDYRSSPEINDFLGGLNDLEKAVELNPECAYAWAYLSRARLKLASQASAMEAACA